MEILFVMQDIYFILIVSMISCLIAFMLSTQWRKYFYKNIWKPSI